MPPQFYQALVALDFKRFFVVADQNQQITDKNSSRKDIEDGLDIDTERVIELMRNYRNRHHVAKLARKFYTRDPASPPPGLPREDSGPVPLLYTYDETRLDKVAGSLLQYADRNPRRLIGIIAPNNKVRRRYVTALESANVTLDSARPKIVTFWGDERPQVRFDEGGILVINAQACKGLEFDTVDARGHRRTLLPTERHRRYAPSVLRDDRTGQGPGVHVHEAGPWQ